MIAAYVLLTGLRDYCDNFAAELWHALGYTDKPSIFTTSAIYSSLIILAVLSLFILVKDNVRALLFNHLLIIVGFLTIGGTSLLFQTGLISGATWMVCLTVGIYVAYVPFNCLVFDRLVANLNSKANAGFLIYVADSAGYAGSVGILLYKTFADVELSWLQFLVNTSYFAAIAGALLILGSALYFSNSLYKAEPKLQQA